uniref:Uncharacterized protein n=1 Tax=Solanum lycopersicum TaxID=4081 RepID=A0A3Q7FIU6_SOLLC
MVLDLMSAMMIIRYKNGLLEDTQVPDLGSDGPSLIGSRRSSDDSNNADRVPDLESGNPSIGSRRSSD